MKSFLLIFLLMSSFSSSTWAGEEVGNGGGIAENNVLFAYRNMGKYIQYCLSLKSCQADEEERDILASILESLPEEYQNKNQVRLLSGRKYPHIFRDNFENDRFAVTGSKVGSVIYVNKDRLYQNSGGRITHTSLLQAISMLIHEFGHHHGVQNHVWLNALGARVARVMDANIIQVPLGPKAKNIIARVVQTNDPGENFSFDNVMLSDGDKYFDLASIFSQTTSCPVVDSEILELIGLSIWQPHWARYRSPAPYLKGDIIFYCQSPSTEKVYIFDGNTFSLFPTFKLSREGKTLIKNIRFRYTTCSQDPIGCQLRRANYSESIRTINTTLNFYHGGN
jgi:hypothetical protein